MRAPARGSYLRVVLLAGVVLLGWLWDSALGGGRAHAVGWLIALVLVTGVTTLVVRSAREHHVAGPAPDLAGSAPDVAVAATPDELSLAPVARLADRTDLAALPDVQRSAGALFVVAHIAALPHPEPSGEAVVFAVGAPPVGFLTLSDCDGNAHIDGVWVVPAWMRKGCGSALLRAAERWAFEHGHPQLTVLSRVDVPWQSQFFAHGGFRQIEPGVQLAARLDTANGDRSAGASVALGKLLVGDVERS